MQRYPFKQCSDIPQTMQRYPFKQRSDIPSNNAAISLQTMQRYPFKRGVSNTRLALAQEAQPFDTSHHSVSRNVTKVGRHQPILYELLGSIPDRNSAVGTANNCRLGWQKGEIFLYSKTTETKCGAQPASYSIGIAVLSRGQSGLDVKSTTPPCSAEFKNECSYTTAPHMPSWRGQGHF